MKRKKVTPVTQAEVLLKSRRRCEEQMKVEMYSIKNSVTVDCDIGFIPIDGTYKKIGYFKAFGEYKLGSAGNSDARHICGMMAYAQERFTNSFWILDLSELSYEWGDEMDMILDFGAINGIDSVAVVYGTNCIAAVATLAGMDRAPEELLAEEGNFINIQDAYEFLLAKIN